MSREDGHYIGKQYAPLHAISLYLHFLGWKTGLKAAMMTAPYEE